MNRNRFLDVVAVIALVAVVVATSLVAISGSRGSVDSWFRSFDTGGKEGPAAAGFVVP